MDKFTPTLTSGCIDFIAQLMDGGQFDGTKWVDQITERLNSSLEVKGSAWWKLERLITEPRAQEIIERIYEWYRSLISGDTNLLANFHSSYQFIAVVGAPRGGGSYLTAELFSSLGIHPASVPASIAHDGTPDAKPFVMGGGQNEWMSRLAGMSEFLTMIEVFYGKPADGGKIRIPKKLTKSVYAGGFFKAILGEDAEYIVTVRHPIASCISTYEKSGGLPSGPLKTTRSAIEKWVKRDVEAINVSTETNVSEDYFDSYVRYWEQYYVRLAMSGLLVARAHKIVPFSKEEMEETANLFHERYSSGTQPGDFLVQEGAAQRHPSWLRRADEAMNRVASIWSLAGLTFPTESLKQCL